MNNEPKGQNEAEDAKPKDQSDPEAVSLPASGKDASEFVPERNSRFSSLVLVGAIFLALWAGVHWAAFFHRTFARAQSMAGMDEVEVAQEASSQFYTCGMHSWIVLPQPGSCPICGMTLVPIDPAKFAGEIRIDPVVVQNIGVRVGVVTRGPLRQTVRTVGNVTYDETRVRDVNTKIDGWIEKIYVDSLGAKVEAGEKLFDLYSPELYTAQEEYLLAFRDRNQVVTGLGPEMARASLNLLESTRIRMEYFDITPQQIRDLERAGKPSKTMTVLSPYAGVVIEKEANEGMKITQGKRVYRIADLSRVWVKATLYEYQLPFLELGQKAVMTLPYIPGQTFEGRVLYIYPYLDSRTRSVEVRLEFDNPVQLLKPGMFVQVELQSQLARERVLAPREAVIDTGERQVAFVSLGGGKFEPRELRTGIETEDGRIEVLDGLQMGEMVVTSSQFLIDSEARIRDALAKMIKGNLAADQETAAEVAGASELAVLPEAAAKELAGMLDDYFAIGRLLANDTVSGILLEAGGLAAGVSALLEVEIPENPHFWHQHSEAATIRGKALEIAESQNLETARLALADLSVAFSKLLRATGIPPSYGSEVQELVCPMWREGQGGSVWLQPAGTVRNPFLGEAMSSCFEGRRTLPVTGSRVLDAVASTTKDAQRHQGHTGNTLALERMDLSPAEQERLDQFVTRYLALEEALVASDLKAARVGVEALREAAKGMEAGPLEGLAAKVVAAAGTEAESLETLRIDFKNLSARVAELVRMAPPSSEVAPVLFRAWCPMAKAEWLQTSSTIANPYYGQAMLTCGSVQEQIPARSSP